MTDLEIEEASMHRTKMRKYINDLYAAAIRQGDHMAQRICELAVAALDYGASHHCGDSCCSAGDHDNCSSRQALEKLEALVGGPTLSQGPYR